uniref:Uncharacterized protein n=1 Tax=Plectus sambesii TaxID=2011161 RepID=A0A914VB12_9BILA
MRCHYEARSFQSSSFEFPETDGWYFLLQPKYGLRKHLAVSKVNMLTYYGSVDSGLQGSDDHSSNQVL